MKEDGSYPREISSDHDVSNLGKKRKFLAETTDHFSSPASKYICYEALVEHDPLSKESLQAKVFYTHLPKSKAFLEEENEDIDSKPDGCAKQCSNYESSISGDAACSLNSTGVSSLASGEYSMSYQNAEFHQEENCEGQFDEYGHCLGYLASACNNDSNRKTDEEFEVLLYSNGMVPTSYLLSPERLTAEKESQLSARKPTIDQDFEQYFAMLTL